MTCGISSLRQLSGKILLVRHMLHPRHRRTVRRFLDRDVRYGARAGSSMPVLVAGRAPDDIAAANFDALFSFALSPADASSDDQRLAERMRMPSRSRAGLEGDAG